VKIMVAQALLLAWQIVQISLHYSILQPVLDLTQPSNTVLD